MTREEQTERFFKFHGRTWDYFRRSEAWEDFMNLLRTYDPSRDIPNVTAQSASQNTTYLLGTIAGFNGLMNAVENFRREEQTSEPDSTFPEQQTE